MRPAPIWPMTAHIARRQCLISLSASSSVISNSSGLRPKSPGARSPDARPAVVATPDTASIDAMKMSAATIAFGCSSHASQNTCIWLRPSATGQPGSGPNISTQITPVAASMATRPCLISASRSQYKSMPRSSISERPSGSKPTSPAMVPSRFLGCSRNGMDSEFDASAVALRGAAAGPTRAPAPPSSARATTDFIVSWCLR
mmetsp:Transcript_10586/g.32614  ORF Transcript_10586/g.32614 Transcript_10586/m.32614 type:complete len:202 (+) Transcript_10586:130-735(+)